MCMVSGMTSVPIYVWLAQISQLKTPFKIAPNRVMVYIEFWRYVMIRIDRANTHALLEWPALSPPDLRELTSIVQ